MINDLVMIAIGYAICVVIPIPYVNSWMLAKWSQLRDFVKSKF